MALVKPDEGIESIKGKFGGQYFSRDSSGLHLSAMPRTVKYARSDAQIDQNWWYSSKKYAEKFPYPDFPAPDDEIPPGTHVVYSLETIFAHRQPSLFEPTKTECDYTGFWMDEIRTWIFNNWSPAWAAWGLTKDLMFVMMAKWFYVARGTWGFGSAVALASAKANMTAWISASAAAVAVPLLGLWLGLVGMQFYYAFTSWLEPQGGSIRFTTGRVIIRKDSTVWWGGLVGRPSKKFYDFAICGLSPYEGNTRSVTPAGHPYKLNWFYSSELWQTASHHLVFWYVYTWKTIRSRLRGKGYKIRNNRIRMEVNPSQHDYWQKPIGWSQSNSDACAYLNQFDEHFAYQSHPADPL